MTLTANGVLRKFPLQNRQNYQLLIKFFIETIYYEIDAIYIYTRWPRQLFPRGVCPEKKIKSLQQQSDIYSYSYNKYKF